MDITNLGAECYHRFRRERVMKALDGVEGLDALKRCSLSSEEAEVAQKRGFCRLDRYYENLQGIAKEIRHSDLPDALLSIKEAKKQDEVQLSNTYRALTSKVEGEGEDYPGMALFLMTGGRSIALLPEVEASIGEAQVHPVYMASAWRNAAFVNVSADRALLDDFKARILRSNRLWQRERWWVMPVSNRYTDTAEPFGFDQAAYFNNISEHHKGVDGWVDAFWGVQSGIRLSLPVAGGDDTRLIILLTTFRPDAFSFWSGDGVGYMKEVPHEIALQATRRLQKEFEVELQGLSFAASALKDVSSSETTVLEAAMRMLAHYYFGQVERIRSGLWESRVFNLIDQLSFVSSDLYERIRCFEDPRSLTFKRLQEVASALPESEPALRWRVSLESAQQEQAVFSILPRDCTVDALFKALKALERDMESSVYTGGHSVTEHNRIIDIDSFLLTAIAENIVNKHNVSLSCCVKQDSDLGRPVLSVAAFYPRWDMTAGDERNFLLKPLKREDGKRERVGFYLTAQVLWRSGGTVEYYRLGQSEGRSAYQALINLKMPLRG